MDASVRLLPSLVHRRLREDQYCSICSAGLAGRTLGVRIVPRASAAGSAQRKKSRPATDRNAALHQQIPQQIAQVRKHATACGDQNSATQFCEGVDDGVSFDERPIGRISRTRQHNDECTTGKADADTKAEDHADDDHQPTTRAGHGNSPAATQCPAGERGVRATGDIPCEAERDQLWRRCDPRTQYCRCPPRTSAPTFRVKGGESRCSRHCGTWRSSAL
jgi:hypothetical protein